MSARAQTKPIRVGIDADSPWSWRRALIFMIVTALAAWGGIFLVGYAILTTFDGLA
jgi:hypothetical protein